MLSVAKIASAALAIVDRKGEFSVNEVARALGVRPSSLYNHLTGKAEIVEAMRSLVFQELDPPPLDDTDDWESQLRELLRRYRDAFAAHPRLVPLLTAYTVSSPDVMALYEQMAAALARAGVPDDELLTVITVLDNVVIGSALDLAAPEEVWSRDAAQGPLLAAAIEASATGRERADRAFELGIDLVLGSLVRRLAAG
ncbi:TetR/AcrR family transcriptional regulator C-terminal domain-containing protein [Aeromicrobium sp. IC_218]|uniref:TetR/AcrR family transcriptional regulator n=1 Tax=Aeromicrobium sp. IC_218 TaxID=2545468 RepID=UPI0013F43A6F|nr:TetR/AcrR family transcriptional regulator C-terminal domain-containing protein [Aeromicrobium sp. IC_218]